MAERCGSLRLVLEALHELSVGAELRPQDLDRDLAAELVVSGPEDGGHAPLTQHLVQAVAATDAEVDLGIFDEGRFRFLPLD